MQNIILSKSLMDELPERGHCKKCGRETRFKPSHPTVDAYGPGLNGILMWCATCATPQETFVEATVDDRKKYMSVGFFQRVNS